MKDKELLPMCAWVTHKKQTPEQKRQKKENRKKWLESYSMRLGQLERQHSEIMGKRCS